MKSVRDILGLSNCFLIGSRAFNVHNKHSDYDIVIKKSAVPDKIMNIYDIFDLREYFNVVPLGNSWLIRINLKDTYGIKVDLIVIEDDMDIEIYRKSVDALMGIPKPILENKILRVTLFEHMMKYYGFKQV